MLELVRRRRIPALVVGAVVVAAAVSTFLATRAPAAPTLDAVSAHDLIASAIEAGHDAPSVSGTAHVHVDLGLPQLPSSTEAGPVSGPLGILAEFSGDHTLRVWRSRDGVRIADILPAEERAVFATKNDLWLWDSTNLDAYHVLPPAGGSAGDTATGQQE